MFTRLLFLRDLMVSPASRAWELAALRRQLIRQPGRWRIGAQELRLARELRGLRVSLCAALPSSSACGTCAEHYPPPHGAWSGGYCCGAPTMDLFTDDEIASLRAAGTSPLDLRAPAGQHAGCIFRGPAGCSLAPAHRPNICVRHICWDLARELQARGELTRIEELSQQIRVRFERFVAIRRDRLDSDLLTAWPGRCPAKFIRDILAHLRDHGRR